MRQDNSWTALRALWMLMASGLWLAQAALATVDTKESQGQTDAPPVSVAVQTSSANATVRYNRDILPLLSDNCFACHGPDSASRKADLRLDHFADATASRKGTAPIVPGHPEQSEVMARLLTDDPDDLMPPPKTHKKLTPAQIELIRTWIAEGAVYELHWAYLPPRRAEPPTVQHKDWVRNPIDSFILVRLEKEGLSPAPEADRRTLARRLSLDLTGLPPSPEVVEAFVSNQSPEAYEELVDQFLASQAWGEHRGRYWLDVARYADTHGIHFDNFREMWSYRDWVIQAFNDNMPFDQFSVQQLAGDLLPNRTLDQQIASGFNRSHITSNEGGIIDEEYLVLYTRDRTETTSAVWLGTTANCATCHDHKFDPLTTREFYEMSAFFNNSTVPARDGNRRDPPPTIVVPRDEDRARWLALDDEISAGKEAVQQRRQSARREFDAWLIAPDAKSLADQATTRDLLVHVPLNEGEGRSLHSHVGEEARSLELSQELIWEAGQVAAHAFKVDPDTPVVLGNLADFGKEQAFSYGAWIKMEDKEASGGILARMDEPHGYRGWDLFLDKERVAVHFIHQWPDDAFKVTARPKIELGKWTHVFATYDGSGKPAGVKLFLNGRPVEMDVNNNSLKGQLRADVPFTVGRRHGGSALEKVSLQDARVYGRQLDATEVEGIALGTRAAWLAGLPAAERTEEQTNELFDAWLRRLDEPYRQAASHLAALEQEESDIRNRGTVGHVMQERSEDAMAYILHRGEYDKRRERVLADTPDVLPPMPEDFPRNRLGFARWLFLPEHPLTARVTVNRFWQQVFGTGLVKTAGDFGVAGEAPSHPELLDWLAVEFRESGWDVKAFFRLLVTSAAYRQSALHTPEAVAKDPDNRLLSRGPRFRMDAEMVRDYALAASGLLVSKVGGASVKPYQPEGVWEAVAMPESNTKKYERDHGDNLYRRSLYTFWKRSAPPASMDIFNAPSRETCTVRRERTNTPLQALVTLNDPQFIEAARRLAERALREGGADAASRLDYVARRLLSRSLQSRELEVTQNVWRDLLAYYTTEPKDAEALIAVGESKADPSLPVSELAAYTMAVNQLMNLDEVLTK